MPEFDTRGQQSHLTYFFRLGNFFVLFWGPFSERLFIFILAVFWPACSGDTDSLTALLIAVCNSRAETSPGGRFLLARFLSKLWFLTLLFSPHSTLGWNVMVQQLLGHWYPGACSTLCSLQLPCLSVSTGSSREGLVMLSLSLCFCESSGSWFSENTQVVMVSSLPYRDCEGKDGVRRQHAPCWKETGVGTVPSARRSPSRCCPQVC